ncbi:hypothetical protein LX32DRAFT_637585 [Colletotrichum zoysiae]|uniref:Uncharacterized protein n=1 Tax=Colletotrichum zoysiae TaxID=1216348 RepID=A0AAD9HMZ2_9PEZI|nr:hypothetical protein LX32DRAFT_637585 [Colletotrichum zoysiae]
MDRDPGIDAPLRRFLSARTGNLLCSALSAHLCIISCPPAWILHILKKLWPSLAHSFQQMRVFSPSPVSVSCMVE